MWPYKSEISQFAIRNSRYFSIHVLFVSLTACSLSGGATESVPKTWWLKDLAMFSNPRVTVTDEEENPLGRFSTRALRNLSRAKIGIADASGLYTELVIVEGAEPDAFAGFFASDVAGIPAGTPVIFMSLGLVGRLERDSDAAAYLIGHETAHLLKRHLVAGETQGVLLRRIRVLTESGANDTARPATEAALFTVSRPAAPYTEAEEKSAHEAGVRYATAAGYDAAGAGGLARILKDTPAGSSPWGKQHPTTLGGPVREP